MATQPRGYKFDTHFLAQRAAELAEINTALVDALEGFANQVKDNELCFCLPYGRPYGEGASHTVRCQKANAALNLAKGEI